MGDLNLDLSKSKAFSAGIYTMAAAGAGVGIATYGTGTLLSTVAYGTLGALAGGIGIPVALTAVAVVGYAGYVGIAAAAKSLKKEGAVVPLGMAIAGYSAAKALIVNPVLAAQKFVKGLLPTSGGDAKPTTPATTQVSAPQGKASAFFQKIRLKPLFEKALGRKTSSASKPAPKPKNAPKPPTV